MLNLLPLEIVNYISQFLTEEQDWKALGEVNGWCNSACRMDRNRRKRYRRFYVGTKYTFNDKNKHIDQMIWNIEVKCDNNIIIPNDASFMEIKPQVCIGYITLVDFMLSSTSVGGWRKWCFFQTKDTSLPLDITRCYPIYLLVNEPTIVRFDCDVSKYKNSPPDYPIVMDMMNVDDERQQVLTINSRGELVSGYLNRSQWKLFNQRAGLGPRKMVPVAIMDVMVKSWMREIKGLVEIKSNSLEYYVIPETYDWLKMPYPIEYRLFINSLKGKYQDVMSEELWEWIENESGWLGIKKWL